MGREKGKKGVRGMKEEREKEREREGEGETEIFLNRLECAHPY